MSTLVTRQAPDFTAKAVMADNSFADLTLSSFRGKHVVVFDWKCDGPGLGRGGTGTLVDDKDYQVPFRFTRTIDTLTVTHGEESRNTSSVRSPSWLPRFAPFKSAACREVVLCMNTTDHVMSSDGRPVVPVIPDLRYSHEWSSIARIRSIPAAH